VCNAPTARRGTKTESQSHRRQDQTDILRLRLLRSMPESNPGRHKISYSCLATLAAFYLDGATFADTQEHVGEPALNGPNGPSATWKQVWKWNLEIHRLLYPSVLQGCYNCCGMCCHTLLFYPSMLESASKMLRADSAELQVRIWGSTLSSARIDESVRRALHPGRITYPQGSLWLCAILYLARQRHC
jgi:hypothetical protein